MSDFWQLLSIQKVLHILEFAAAFNWNYIHLLTYCVLRQFLINYNWCTSLCYYLQLLHISPKLGKVPLVLLSFFTNFCDKAMTTLFLKIVIYFFHVNNLH